MSGGGATSVQFYHLTATPLERALPKLMEKVLASGFRALLTADSPARLQSLDELLWTYDPGSFLPHGAEGICEATLQPVLLSLSPDAPKNQAKLLVVTDGNKPANPGDYERILDVFDGKNAEAVASARTRWTQYKEAGHEVTYLRQNEQGSWQKP